MSNPTSALDSTDQQPKFSGVRRRWDALPPIARSLVGWLGLFAGVVLLKRDALLLPASWDESWAVLPGGLWLSDNGFDILGLVHQPQWYEYGPATYALAPVTWMTGIVAILAKSTTTFLLSLHLVHMAIGAVGLREVYRFARPVWSPTASSGLVLATALVPVMNAQLGFMYLEIPIFTAGMLTINAGLAGRWKRVAFWGALATSVKASGIIPLGAIVATSLMAPPALASLRKSILVLLPAALVGLIPILLGAVGEANRDLTDVLASSSVQILRMPELAVALFLAATFGVLSHRPGRSPSHDVELRLKLFAWQALLFVGFYTFTILFVVPIYVLPRYFTILVPVTLFAAWDVGARRFGHLIAGIIGLMLVGSMVFNQSGTFFAERDAVTSVGLESSNAYVGRLLLTDRTIDEAVATGDPVYLSANLWFRTQYPRLGYVEAVPGNVHLLIDLDIDQLPERFVVVESEFNLLASEIFETLDTTTEYRPETTQFKLDGFTARYVTYIRISG